MPRMWPYVLISHDGTRLRITTEQFPCMDICTVHTCLPKPSKELWTQVGIQLSKSASERSPSARLLGSTIQIAAISDSLLASCTESDDNTPDIFAACTSLRIDLTPDLLAVNVVQPNAAPHNMLCTVCVVKRGLAFVTAARRISPSPEILDVLASTLPPRSSSGSG